MTEAELKFHFLRWQEIYKLRKDHWQTSQYLDATINHVPNLIWYKDKTASTKQSTTASVIRSIKPSLR